MINSPTLDASTPTVTPPYGLTPYPDALLDELQSPGDNPAVEYDLYESAQLAFLVAMQRLRPRQRAVLLLHDVVGFTLADVAEMLESNGCKCERRAHSRTGNNARISKQYRSSDTWEANAG
jgi:DNA-directed RNA polymerase specialized sigma24 family protein